MKRSILIILCTLLLIHTPFSKNIHLKEEVNFTNKLTDPGQNSGDTYFVNHSPT